MRRSTVPSLVLSLLVLAPPVARPAFAHGFGQSHDLPLWLYLYGAGVAVLASFVPISLFAGGGREGEPYPRYDIVRIGPLRAVLMTWAFQFGLRLLSVALFLLVILGGFLGKQAEDYNFAPTFVWIIWWVGLSFFTAFVGNVWPLVNLWKILFEWAEGSPAAWTRDSSCTNPTRIYWGVAGRGALRRFRLGRAGLLLRVGAD